MRFPGGILGYPEYNKENIDRVFFARAKAKPPACWGWGFWG